MNGKPDPREMMQRAKEMARVNLHQGCRELIEWSDTALLVDGIVRSVAAVLEPAVGDDALQLSERLFQHAALEACAAGQSCIPADDVIRDAARYQWLRDDPARRNTLNGGIPWCVQVVTEYGMPTMRPTFGRNLDSAIDTQRLAKGGA